MNWNERYLSTFLITIYIIIYSYKLTTSVLLILSSSAVSHTVTELALIDALDVPLPSLQKVMQRFHQSIFFLNF